VLKRRYDQGQALRSRSIQAYVDHLLAHWSTVIDGGKPELQGLAKTPPAARQETLQSFRAHYKPMLSPTRIRSFLIRWLQTRLIRR
jgi:hypothetical protein